MKYTGACHCGKVQYEVEVEIKDVISCNCSHCQIMGLLLIFVKADQFKLLQGEENLTSYRFNTMKINHLFCNICGVESFSYGKDKEGNDTAAINVRALKDVDLEKLTIVKYDGKNW